MIPTHCDRPMHRHGRTKAGNIRYRCPICGHTLTEGDNTHGGYRHGVRGRTSTDRSRDSRKNRQRQRASLLVDPTSEVL